MSFTKKIPDLRKLRQNLGLNQQEFWAEVGVTQSGGSRYETGRDMPKPVRELVRLVHVEGLDLAHVSGEDTAIVQRLRKTNAKLYKSLQQEVRNKK